MAGDPHGSWVPAAAPAEGESDTLSSAQRSTLKWEKEEALGEMATVAPVLYTNINFPGLKAEFPGECQARVATCPARGDAFWVSVLRWGLCAGGSPTFQKHPRFPSAGLCPPRVSQKSVLVNAECVSGSQQPL